MTNPSPVDHFNQQAAQSYDERNRKLSPIGDCMHFLIQLVLSDLPSRSRILCIGAGTGAEILSLAKAFPDWSFTGVEPSSSMLEVCGRRLAEEGLMDRCELVHGYVQDAPEGENYDAALSVLVAHFIERKDRLDFFCNMVQRLRSGGQLVNTEICFDLGTLESAPMIHDWAKVQTLMGATPASIANLPQMLRHGLNVVAPLETEDFLRQSGIALPVQFFQSFMIRGWHGKKAV